jgi:LytS/YehU family sensor histidine kinase
VYIDLNIEDNKLLFTVQNSVFKRQHFQNNTRDGKGLKNLKQRLNLLYPKSSSLWIKNNNKSYITKLTISLN